MPGFRSTVIRFAKEMLLGEERPKPKGIWTYDLPAINTASKDGDVKAMTGLVDKYGLDTLLRMSPLLHRAALLGHTEMMALLINRGASPAALDARGTTPLHMAAASGQKAAAVWLLRQHAALDAQDSRGWTPLWFAANSGRDEMVQFLLDRDARLDIVCGGKTAAMIAREKGHDAIAARMEQEDAERQSHRLRRAVTVRRIRLKTKGPAA